MNTPSKLSVDAALSADISYANTLMTFGLPLPEGTTHDVQQLALFQKGTPLVCVMSPTAYWPDGSIRWLLCKAIVPESGAIDLRACEEGKRSTRTLDHLPIPDVELSAFVSLKGCDDVFHICLSESRKVSDALVATRCLTGVLQHQDQTLRFECELNACASTGELDLQFHIRNPKAALHSGGRWDLGDPGSCLIESLSLCCEWSSEQCAAVIQDQTSQAFSAVEAPFELCQHGSGGAHWQSPIHWNENKVSTVFAQGFSLESGQQKKQGLRSMPSLIYTTDEKICIMAMENFWQNFPITLEVDLQKTTWQLFPQLTELQGGESKTWHWNIRSLAQQPELMPYEKKLQLCMETTNSFGAHITYSPEYLDCCDILPHLRFTNASVDMSILIRRGLSQAKGFVQKRERNDVFGWRHFGELHADHEATSNPDAEYFISHYNNQYDPLMGMTLQYLQNAQSEWLKLLKPLNLHIQDIDIYDTQEDKPEYNGGLFWHTDHYLPAETCTHRSNSKHHMDVYEGWLGGGGPGGQHCYTTGLMLQYFIFGDQRAKVKTLQLCDWVRRFYRGSGSLAERTFRFLTIDFKQNVITNIGRKSPGYRYPLDRGIGNYLVALLDSYDLNSDAQLLNEMAEVIRYTCHPADDIADRNFDNIEDTWFYTVFFQALVRYLLLKERLKQDDKDYWYARQVFLHYVRWMLENETPYLERPDILEFPNDTWCAQDLRKANLLFFGSYFDASGQTAYLERAEYFYEYVCKHLATSDEGHFTRILALLMQNDGVWQKFRSQPLSPVRHASSGQYAFGAAPRHSTARIVMQYLTDMLRLLLRFSPVREWRWIKGRISQLKLHS